MARIVLENPGPHREVIVDHHVVSVILHDGPTTVEALYSDLDALTETAALYAEARDRLVALNR